MRTSCWGWGGGWIVTFRNKVPVSMQISLEKQDIGQSGHLLLDLVRAASAGNDTFEVLSCNKLQPSIEGCNLL